MQCTHVCIVAFGGSKIEVALLVHGNQIGSETACEGQAGCCTHACLHHCVLLHKLHMHTCETM